jgi:methyltransferase (TIGR00027 family)
MRKGQASTTAKFVALWHVAGDLGLSNVSQFRDPVARFMLDGPLWQLGLRQLESLARKPADHKARRSVLPYYDMMMLRFAFIDAVIEERAPKQVVILGAGLDTRAFRLQALRSARVIEVDHPATQAYKRARVDRLGPPLAELRFAPVDFRHDDLGRRLSDAGFDAAVPTTWVWEGVIMYLDDAALRGTLREVRRLSAAGSTLIAHYHEPDIQPNSRLHRIRRLLLPALGEPQIGLRTRDAVEGEVRAAGFQLIEDAGVQEQAARLGVTAPDLPILQVSRILVASV